MTKTPAKAAALAAAQSLEFVMDAQIAFETDVVECLEQHPAEVDAAEHALLDAVDRAREACFVLWCRWQNRIPRNGHYNEFEAWLETIRPEIWTQPKI